VSELHEIRQDAEYIAVLIEGYDIKSIRRINERLTPNSFDNLLPYVKKRLSFGNTGSLETESAFLSLPELSALVEDTVVETCQEFELIHEGDGVLLGLSGGVDSSSLLLALSAACSHLPKFRLVAVTFEDFDSQESPAFQHASELAKNLGIEHHIASAGLAEEVFHLNTPLRKILPSLMDTPFAHHVMYIDHHTTRRTLEVFAEKQDLNRVALGLHTTDLIGGLLNGWMTGYDMADIPLRQIGELTYIYPLAFVHKRELHLYHLHQTGKLARHTTPNAWEKNPKDRNFYYYLADTLQAYWPSLETMLFAAHNLQLKEKHQLKYEHCSNCGASFLPQPLAEMTNSLCDACVILAKAGFIK
jgi:tRNA(Ile)-lysidine synthase TilS/MesJ